MTRPKVICNLCVTYELLIFFNEKDTDRARLHKQSDRQKKLMYGHMSCFLYATIQFACGWYK